MSEMDQPYQEDQTVDIVPLGTQKVLSEKKMKRRQALRIIVRRGAQGFIIATALTTAATLTLKTLQFSDKPTTDTNSGKEQGSSVPKVTLSLQQTQDAEVLESAARSGATIEVNPDNSFDSVTLSDLTDQTLDVIDVTSKNKRLLSARKAMIREIDGREVRRTVIFVPESVEPQYRPDLPLSLLRFEVCRIKNDRRQEPNLMLATIFPPSMMKP